MLGDLRQPRWLYFKAVLLLCVGVLASVVLILKCPEWQNAVILAIAVWGFCRAYYFAFYVVQHYIDPSYKFAGLISFARYVCAQRHSMTPVDRENNEPPRTSLKEGGS